VPGSPYAFGFVHAAQARGDLDVLAERGRQVVRLHLGADAAGGLARLRTLLEQAGPPGPESSREISAD